MNGVRRGGGLSPLCSVAIQTRSIETRAGDSDTTHRCTSTGRKWWKDESGRQTEPQVYYCLTDIKFKKASFPPKFPGNLPEFFENLPITEWPENCWNSGRSTFSNWSELKWSHSGRMNAVCGFRQSAHSSAPKLKSPTPYEVLSLRRISNC